MKRIISHVSVLFLAYAMYKGIYGALYFLVNLSVNKLGMGLLFVYFIMFLWPLTKVVDWGAKKLSLNDWIRIGIIAALGAVGAFVTLKMHHQLYHEVNQIAILGTGYYNEILFTAIFMLPALFIAEFLWQYPRKYITGAQIATWAIMLGILWMTDTRYPDVPYTDEFNSQWDNGRICSYRMSEASGLAVSRNEPRIMWTHNDYGGKNRVYPIGNQGEYGGFISLKGIPNRDWEDIALGPGPKQGKDYLYLAEIGDNHGIFQEKCIYRFPEPAISLGDFPIDKEIDSVETIRFRYPDGKRDAETLLVDPRTKDIYIITKREKHPHIYLLLYPQATDKLNVAKKIGKLPFFNVTGGDISPDGSEVVLKTYDQIFYWRRGSGERLRKMFKRPPLQIPYVPERQGEAIAWASDGSGFYTFSERRRGPRSHIFFFERNWEKQQERDSLRRVDSLHQAKIAQELDSLKALKDREKEELSNSKIDTIINTDTIKEEQDIFPEEIEIPDTVETKTIPDTLISSPVKIDSLKQEVKKTDSVNQSPKPKPILKPDTIKKPKPVKKDSLIKELDFSSEKDTTDIEKNN